MNTYKRLQTNMENYIDELQSRINKINCEIGDHPLRDHRLRRQRKALYEQINMIRGRYYTIMNETRIIQYHA